MLRWNSTCKLVLLLSPYRTVHNWHFNATNRLERNGNSTNCEWNVAEQNFGFQLYWAKKTDWRPKAQILIAAMLLESKILSQRIRSGNEGCQHSSSLTCLMTSFVYPRRPILGHISRHCRFCDLLNNIWAGIYLFDTNTNCMEIKYCLKYSIDLVHDDNRNAAIQYAVFCSAWIAFTCKFWRFVDRKELTCICHTLDVVGNPPLNWTSNRMISGKKGIQFIWIMHFKRHPTQVEAQCFAWFKFAISNQPKRLRRN